MDRSGRHGAHPATTVVCCGLTTLDVTQTVDAVPRPDEKVVARSVRVDVGGPAANAARTAAALGAPTTLVTALGTGPLAELARALLTAAGVRVVDVATDDAGPALSTVLVTAGTGERAVVSANAVGRAVGGCPPDVLDGAGALLVDGHLLAVQVPLAQQARERGAVVLLDGGSWKPGLDGLLRNVDVALVSADFGVPDHAGAADHDGDRLSQGGPPDTLGDARPPDTLAAIAAHGPTLVAQSHGAGPLEVLTAGHRYRIDVPAVAPSDVVDTLGAGDVLHGAAAAHLAAGAAWPDAIREGARVATRSVRAPGALGWAASGG